MNVGSPERYKYVNHVHRLYHHIYNVKDLVGLIREAVHPKTVLEWKHEAVVDHEDASDHVKLASELALVIEY